MMDAIDPFGCQYETARVGVDVWKSVCMIVVEILYGIGLIQKN